MASREGIGVGVIGCGAIAQLVHLPILTKMEDVRVVAVCDVKRAKATSVAERFQVTPIFESVEDFLQHAGLDAVIVCTPNDLHAEHAEAALQAGKAVLCERPLGISRQQVARTLEAAGTSGRPLMVANNHRYRPDAWALRQAVSRGDLGRVFHVRASWQRRRTGRPRVSEWRLNRSRGGGVLMDLGVTNLDLALWLLGYPPPKRLTAYLQDRDKDGVEDSAVVLLRLEDETTCNVEVSWDLAALEDRHNLFALAESGWGSLSPFVVQKEAGGRVVDATPRLPPGTENVYRASYRRELDYFLRCARGESDEPLPAEQEVLMEIVDACYRSSDEGREIVL